MTPKPSAFPERDDEPALPERIWILGHNTIHSAKNPAGFYYVVEPAYPNAFGGPYIPEVIASERESRAREEAFKTAAQYVRWKMEALGRDIHPAAKCAYEEAIRTIETWNMPRSSVMEASRAYAVSGQIQSQYQQICPNCSGQTIDEGREPAPTTEKGNEG